MSEVLHGKTHDSSDDVLHEVLRRKRRSKYFRL
jgi:hypothetical protein